MCSLFEDIPNAPAGGILYPLRLAAGLSLYFLSFLEWDSRTTSCGLTAPPKVGDVCVTALSSVALHLGGL